MATLQQEQFVSQYGPYATQAGAALGVNPTIILGQWAQETGWGSHIAAPNNLAGLGYTGSGYTSYSSPQEFTNAYISTLQNPRYSGALNAGSDSTQFVTGLKSGGYFTGDYSTYQNNVTSNAATIVGINPSLATSDMAQGPNTQEGYGTDGSGTGTTPSIDVGGTTPGTTYNPNAAPGTFGSETTTTGSTTGSTPGTGGAVNVGLQSSTVTDVGGWISNIETAVGTAFKNAWDATIGQIENLALRFFVVMAAIVIIAIALWRLMDPDMSKTRGLMEAAA